MASRAFILRLHSLFQEPAILPLFLSRTTGDDVETIFCMDRGGNGSPSEELVSDETLVELAVFGAGNLSARLRRVPNGGMGDGTGLPIMELSDFTFFVDGDWNERR